MKNIAVQHRTARRSFLTAPVTKAYERMVDAGEVRRDNAQVALAAKLDVLHESLASLPPRRVRTNKPTSSSESRRPLLLSLVRTLVSARSFFRKKFDLWYFGSPPRGIYIHGPVGVGKSFLMDLFYASVAGSADNYRCNNRNYKHAKITKRRVHFHEFMLDVHHRIFVYKQQYPRDDALPIIAQQLAQEAQLLCFDEFQVTDVADAMILKRLFLFLSEWNVVVVATSNRAPDALYEGGINRSLFLPFIDMLEHTFDIVSMEDSSVDYRLETRADGQSYFWSSKDAYGGVDDYIQAQLEEIFGGTAFTTETESISVHFGRTVQVARLNDRCAWFEFSELCYQPLGAADYISLCRRFPVIIMERVPQLNANHLNEARRFVTLIDACYESRTRLVLAAQVPLDELFVDFEAHVESSEGDGELIVSEKGGNSSSFATTMIRTKEGEYYEWSATGRVGVSLAQFSSASDLAFSFRRAASRLVEMGGQEWGRQ
nr:cell division protein ZapE [Alteromonas portus]